MYIQFIYWAAGRATCTPKVVCVHVYGLPSGESLFLLQAIEFSV